MLVLLMVGGTRTSLAADTCKSSPAAQAVCDDPDLKKLNDELVKTTTAVITHTYETSYAIEHREWIAERDRTCRQPPLKPCLTELYRGRLDKVKAQLAEVMTKPSARDAGKGLNNEPQRVVNLGVNASGFSCEEGILSHGLEQCKIQISLALTVSRADDFSATGSCTIKWDYRVAENRLTWNGTKRQTLVIYGFGPDHFEVQRVRFEPSNSILETVTQIEVRDVRCSIDSIY